MHAHEQLELMDVDMIAGRIRLLGGICGRRPSAGDRADGYPPGPDGAEPEPAMLSRLLEDHVIVISKIRDGITLTSENRDDGTDDALMGDVLRTNELQVGFVAENLVDTPLVKV